MDAFPGIDSDPITLHKYLYGNGDPGNVIDPSGNFGLVDIGISLDIRAALGTIGQVSGRQFVKKAITGSLRTAQAAAKEAVRCLKNPRRCNLTVPILVVGVETKKTSKHILAAMSVGGGISGQSSNRIASPFFLSRKSPPNSRSWIRNNRACRGKVGGVTGKSCDEYPFASSRQGGRRNSPRVSLMPVPVLEQRRQGGLLSAFYRVCKISKTRTSANPLNDKNRFLVVPTPSSIGFPLCLR